VRRNFYRRLLAHSEMSLNRLPLLIAKNILKYYGDITIEGLLDCANHLMAGNELKSALGLEGNSSLGFKLFRLLLFT